MTPQVDHIFLTRFNLPSLGQESRIRNQDGWLERRVELFERYCLPSVRAQSDAEFSWIIYFDPSSPDWFKAWIERNREAAFVPKYRSSVSTSELREDLDSVVPNKARTLLTTNLDNDDGLGLDFVRQLRRAQFRAPRMAVYFERGLILSPAGLYLRKDRHNAFCSVAEGWDEPVSCWADWHNRLHLSMPAQVLAGSPQWLQVVHGSNVSNRTRGRMVSPTRYARGFIGLDTVVEPASTRLLSDRLVISPARGVRDGVRSSVRRTAVAALGKERATTMKETLAGVLHRVPEVQPDGEVGGAPS